MASPPTERESRADPTRSTLEDDERTHRALEERVPSLAKPIRVTGFWGGIILPVFYVPLLVTGLSTSFEFLLFLGLVALNLLALYVGRVHRQQ
ncbi:MULTISPECIES: hypothetical protein [Natronorubrum]|uniref:Uncharacterized protein n=2 Tax=Natronorubrum TaxID=134813 RepID=A0A1N7DZS9_9EURY|nr:MULTISPECIES: hypothetical protein [Natronorubrum]APX96267.1 hypothetical protein BB347_06320 [Natronorubrum daqingense]SEH14740.1 hypothetical protein SAMN04487967_1744 [Natronorubrum sediminis]SIR81296.1 hypothetical protein SAMN05421809_2352 [Natronorubrum daqingense]